jgi:hypothetical protein
VLLGLGWFFTCCWAAVLVGWAYVAFYRARRRHWLLIILGIVPFFHIGDAITSVFTHTHCLCGECVFQTWSGLYSWVTFYLMFALGRLCALLLCIYLIATGAGSVRPTLICRNWVMLLVVFTAFPTALALSLPLTAITAQIDAYPAVIASLILYVVIFVVIVFEADANARVLKAQLLMIRAEGIEPQSCPAWSKFRLFTRIRKYVLAYFVVHVIIILTRVMTLSLAVEALILVAWEVMQLSITATIGWLFAALGAPTNPYLEREPLMDSAAVTNRVFAEEVTLDWSDLDVPGPITPHAEGAAPTGAAAAPTEGTGGASVAPVPAVPLRPWEQSMAVPPPPELPILISTFGGGRNRQRVRASPVVRTSTTQRVGEGASAASSAEGHATSIEMTTAPATPNVPPSAAAEPGSDEHRACAA